MNVTKDITHVEKLLLLGPSRKVEHITPSLHSSYVSDGYKSLCYSGAIEYLYRKRIQPHYYCFLDPNSYRLNYKIFTSPSYFQRTSLIIPDMYQDNLKVFYRNNFTCNNFRAHTTLYDEFRKLDFLKNFSQVVTKENDKCISLFSPLRFEDWSKSFCIYTGDKKVNVDKFAGYLMPLVLNYFTGLKKVVCVGFGDYDVPRYQNSNSKGYGEFKQTFLALLPTLKSNLRQRKITIDFINENYYSKFL